jgi:hypothetical protein
MDGYGSALRHIYNDSPVEVRSDVCRFLNRHRGNLLIEYGIRGDCPLQIGCKYYVSGFCMCVCQNPCSDLISILKRIVTRCQTWAYELDTRKERLALVNYLDDNGSAVFYL